MYIRCIGVTLLNIHHIHRFRSGGSIVVFVTRIMEAKCSLIRGTSHIEPIEELTWMPFLSCALFCACSEAPWKFWKFDASLFNWIHLLMQPTQTKSIWTVTCSLFSQTLTRSTWNCDSEKIWNCFVSIALNDNDVDFKTICCAHSQQQNIFLSLPLSPSDKTYTSCHALSLIK